MSICSTALALSENLVTNVNWFVGYSSSALQLQRFCLTNNIPQLTMHSGRRGVASVAMEMGIERTKIQVCGNWLSNAIDDYFYPVKSGVEYTKKVLWKL